MRGDAEIREDARDGRMRSRGEDFWEPAVVGMEQADALSEGLQPRGGQLEGFGVAIESKQCDIAGSGQDGLGVSAEAHRGIHEEAASLGTERTQCLPEKNWDVDVFFRPVARRFV
jgi:hypothetical protein